MALELGNGVEARRVLRYTLKRKSQDCCEGAFQGDSGEGSERKEESWRESFHLLREYKNTHKQNTGRNVDSQGHSSEVSDGNEGRAIGPWREGDPCYTAARNLAELRSCSSVSWKVELVGYETG